MAIIDNTNTGAVPELPPETPVPQAVPQQPQVTQQEAVVRAKQATAGKLPSRRYWMTNDPSQTGPFSNRKGLINLQDLKARVEEVYASKVPDDPDLTFFTIPMDNTGEMNGAIYYSALLFCMQARLSDNKNSPIIAYAVLLENSNVAPTPTNYNYNGINYEVPLTPDTALDDVFADRAKEYVSRKIKNAEVKFIGGCMLPTSFDSNNIDALDDLIFNSIAAVYTDLRTYFADGNTDVSIPALRESGDQFQSVERYTREPKFDLVGSPMRSDIEITTTTSNSRTKQQGGFHSLNNLVAAVREFGKVNGYVDNVYDPVQIQQNMGMWMQQPMMQPTQKYAARFVITSMESDRIMTPNAVMLMLISALILGDRNKWLESFYNATKSNVKEKGIDFKDVGAFNYEANLPSKANPNGNPNGIGDKVNTKSTDFSKAHYIEFMNKLFRPGLMYAIDVPLSGPQTWYLDIFRAAAREPGGESYQELLKQADFLTAGAFGERFAQAANKEIFVGYNETAGSHIHLGYYTDKNGDRRDIRDIDYLAVLNAFGKDDPDLSTVRAFSDSYYQYTIPERVRLNNRWKIISAVTNESAVLTGMAERLTFNQEFLAALVGGAGYAGLIINNPNNFLFSDTLQRATAGFAGQAVLGPEATARNFNIGNIRTNNFGGWDPNHYSNFYRPFQ